MAKWSVLYESFGGLLFGFAMKPFAWSIGFVQLLEGSYHKEVPAAPATEIAYSAELQNERNLTRLGWATGAVVWFVLGIVWAVLILGATILVVVLSLALAFVAAVSLIGGIWLMVAVASVATTLINTAVALAVLPLTALSLTSALLADGLYSALDAFARKAVKGLKKLRGWDVGTAVIQVLVILSGVFWIPALIFYLGFSEAAEYLIKTRTGWRISGRGAVLFLLTVTAFFTSITIMALPIEDAIGVEWAALMFAGAFICLVCFGAELLVFMNPRHFWHKDALAGFIEKSKGKMVVQGFKIAVEDGHYVAKEVNLSDTLSPEELAKAFAEENCGNRVDTVDPLPDRANPLDPTKDQFVE